ncbi:oxidoreductase [Brachybacterium hainanense]|uniref:FAD-dependent oxidoreductase n=1 Tax=Brachybacterium hainanense TaxID=1541174 RepID=A0ABV6RD15_9MICO
MPAPSHIPAPTPSSPFAHLLSPLDLGPFTVRNRLVMGSMHTGLEDRAEDLPRLAEFLGERARGGAGLIITGGYSPDRSGRLTAHARPFDARTAGRHRLITRTVHEHDGRILLQILHAGRYAAHLLAASASATKAPISPLRARRLSSVGIGRLIRSYAATAARAVEAGYDGVEIMGSEGYLLNQFLAPRTNHRRDRWGKEAAGRRALPLAVAAAVRAALGPDRLLSYRISLLDLVEDGQDWEETLALAHGLVAAGVDVLSTGIGWHEARVPTIATSVPRAAFVPVTARLREAVDVPVVASNRVHEPHLAEQVLARGDADLVSMARPFLADPELPRKLAQNRAREVVACIACNQSCLDRVFVGEEASCLVNPRAARETQLRLVPVPAHRALRVAVVGAGPAGLEAAVAAGSRGHRVTLFEAGQELGGQFLLAARVPGKEDYALALDSWRSRLLAAGVGVRLGVRAELTDLTGYDEIILATGVRPREIALPWIGASPTASERGPRVISYAQLLAGQAEAGRRVAIIGAGGIGVDVAEFLVAASPSPTLDAVAWRERWGIGDPAVHRGGLGTPAPGGAAPSGRTVHLLQRSEGRIGTGLGRTTGWVHRAELRHAGVDQRSGVRYVGVEAGGLRIRQDGTEQLLEVDTVVVCAGQESVRELEVPLRSLAEGGAGPRVHLIGGAERAAQLDAQRAIRQAVEVVAAL